MLFCLLCLYNARSQRTIWLCARVSVSVRVQSRTVKYHTSRRGGGDCGCVRVFVSYVSCRLARQFSSALPCGRNEDRNETAFCWPLACCLYLSWPWLRLRICLPRRDLHRCCYSLLTTYPLLKILHKPQRTVLRVCFCIAESTRLV